MRTAPYETFESATTAKDYLTQTSFPKVIKVDGLAYSKGVFLCRSQEEALVAIDEAFGRFNAVGLIIEDFLEGIEVSMSVISDGERTISLGSAHGYKHLLDGNCGPLTGGMGAVSPSSRFSAEQEEEVLQIIVTPVLNLMRDRGNPYRGFLQVDLMIDKAGRISVIEFNTRLPDPEGQLLLQRWESDPAEFFFCFLKTEILKSERHVAKYRSLQKLNIFERLENTNFESPRIKFSPKIGVCANLVSQGYPHTVIVGDPILGLEAAEKIPGVTIFYAAASKPRWNSRNVHTNAGIVLNVTAIGDSIEEARKSVYEATSKIKFRGQFFRNDIGVA